MMDIDFDQDFEDDIYNYEIKDLGEIIINISEQCDDIIKGLDKFFEDTSLFIETDDK